MDQVVKYDIRISNSNKNNNCSNDDNNNRINSKQRSNGIFT